MGSVPTFPDASKFPEVNAFLPFCHSLLTAVRNRRQLTSRNSCPVISALRRMLDPPRATAGDLWRFAGFDIGAVSPELLGECLGKCFTQPSSQCSRTQATSAQVAMVPTRL